jgi:methionyl-tRNA formyltransferase
VRSVLFLSKKDDARCERALALVRGQFGAVTPALGDWGQPLPDVVREWSGDLMISYLSRWVVPRSSLSRARVAAINFHPGPPEYPGFGCYNWALYENAAQYGATCHHMDAAVDSGRLVAVRRFPIAADDGVASLLEKTHEALLVLFEEVLAALAQSGELPVSGEKWSRRPFRKTQLEELHRITPDMSAAEIQRRVRAVTMGRWRPFIELHGHRFEWTPPT